MGARKLLHFLVRCVHTQRVNRIIATVPPNRGRPDDCPVHRPFTSIFAFRAIARRRHRHAFSQP